MVFVKPCKPQYDDAVPYEQTHISPTSSVLHKNGSPFTATIAEKAEI